MQEYKLKVPPESCGLRLDLFLLKFFKKKTKGFSRTFLQRLILEGKVKLQDLAIIKPHHKIKTGNQITVYIEEKKPDISEAENIPLDIVYEDEDLALINKPAGLVVHPGAGNVRHTLVNALKYHFKTLSDISPQRPGIVHRLDKETSGLLVIAKNNFSHLSLAKQFSEHTVKRKYIALVKGKVEFDEQIIELPIGRHPFKRKNMSVHFGQDTKYAKTYYHTLKRSSRLSFLELEPFTGRTHQLRVHLAYIGHPILGDTKYGKNNTFSRLALHAKSIGFIHPRTEKFLEFNSDIPPEFIEFLKNK